MGIENDVRLAKGNNKYIIGKYLQQIHTRSIYRNLDQLNITKNINKFLFLMSTKVCLIVPLINKYTL